ncbi:hypothetical protein B0A48_07113 [Cryoendolithus antarcticus]|uniref:Uncharacterized protein n=1 Tax=Cryoendolithus antarcticus TaxID=1507870 RepID=A0A1V8T7M6_9PEZI|nr:hypothetical protein B0A48_07113 [Cryoendolithus antarcticus]
MAPQPSYDMAVRFARRNSQDGKRATVEVALCPLLALPPRLQRAIFDLAFPDTPELMLKWRPGSQTSDVPQRRTRAPKWSHKVNEWLVSKAFFAAAARAWMGNQTWHSSLPRVFANPCYGFLKRNNTLFLRYAAHMHVWPKTSGVIKDMSFLQNLRCLTFHLAPLDMRIGGEDGTEHILSDRALSLLLGNLGLLEHDRRHLEGVIAVYVDCDDYMAARAPTAAATHWLGRNARRLESVILSLITKPMKASKPKAAPFAWKSTVERDSEHSRSAVSATASLLVSTIKWSATEWAAGTKIDWAEGLTCTRVAPTPAPLQDQVQLLCKAVPVRFIPFRLFDLPQELQDLVFGFAYPAEPTTRWIFPNEWKLREVEKRRRSLEYVMQPFPRFKIDDWLVSKRYFVGAATAQLGSAVWKTPRAFRLRNDVATQMLRQFIQHIEVNLYQIDEIANSWPGLRHLTVTIAHEWAPLCDQIGKYVWQEHFTDNEVYSLVTHYDLVHVRGLQSFTLKVGHCLYADTDPARNMLDANAARLEAVLRRRVMQPKPSPQWQFLVAHVPIYCGSKVYWTEPSTLKSATSTSNAPVKPITTQPSVLVESAGTFAYPQTTAATAFVAGKTYSAVLPGNVNGTTSRASVNPADPGLRLVPSKVGLRTRTAHPPALRRNAVPSRDTQSARCVVDQGLRKKFAELLRRKN